MTIYEYVKKYNYTFSERPFNEVDNVVFATLSYPYYDGIISDNSNNKKTINEIAKEYIKKYPKNKKGEITAIKMGVKLLHEIIDSPRFKDVLVYNYQYIGNDNSQFSALTFDFNNTLYISYEGTDELISGWEEDFKMSYIFPVEAHKKAIKYLNKYLFTNKKLILGGHSKGGNLALVAGMCTNPFIRSKIINIYSNDGQGLRKKEIESRKYRRIESKYIHLIPHNSIVGLLCRHNKDIVVKASAVTVFSHATSTWLIEDDHFIRGELTTTSKIFDKGMLSWLDKYDDQKRKKFVDEVFNVLKENEIKTLVEIKTNPMDIIKIIKSSNNLSEDVREMINDFGNVMNKIIKENK